MPDLILKLPRPFVDAYGAEIRAHDWRNSGSRLTLALPDLDWFDVVSNEPTIAPESVAELAHVSLTLTIGHRGPTVVAATPGDMLRIRKHADKLAARDPVRYPPPAPDDVALVLKGRNPDLEPNLEEEPT